MSDAYTVLHLGCGRVGHTLAVPEGATIITLDRDRALNPDVVCDLGVSPMRVAENSIDLAVANHVLEHIGKQGETREWFSFWEDLYRVLKPGGQLQFETPRWDSVWAWADPSHTRALSEEAFCFFNQDSYRLAGSSISPYRIRCDFQPLKMRDDGANLRGVLVARKPLRPWWETDADARTRRDSRLSLAV